MSVELIVEDVRALARLDLEGLRGAWRARYGAPPKIRSADLLARLLAWRIQADAFGGLGAEIRTTLVRKNLASGGPKLGPGVRLDREWRGVIETVDVVEGGFRWRDQTYPNLSRVAHAITGVNWNGPRFFGLRGEASA